MPPKIFAAPLLFLAGCSAASSKGDAGAPPVIDTLQMPAQAVIGNDGLYDVDGTISFHSTTSTVATIHVASTDFGVDYEIPGPAVAKATNATLVVNFAAANPIGTTGSYFVSVIDAAGQESTATMETVTLE